ncbi:MAG: recombination protein RecR [Candidatus Yanofskybacteria bacterium RIFCSPHIGHO2_01_FULL_44_17]|uniref:Recombination protein RecR n=1 Tax=Candidatus Yanofskybacteria bacterium RIFCSPHIGHO2_01_FULL_44_17 TaxID=1802668 RepID=A0A1F8ESV6_9BACT|nr:MAG: recombination protein RecR [Candidatus Yanofskybacteria bacterium RIFCSPHIGHO2_01_FULL_44_17]
MSQRVQKLIEFFTKLPGIGPRQAARLVLDMLNWPAGELEEFSQSISGLGNGPILCTNCFNLTDEEKCSICSSHKRDQTRIAVVEKITDLQSMERTGAFNGVYHVLGGTINPSGGSLPHNLKISELLNRILELQKLTPDVEVIIATNPNTYGETTALYLEEELKPLNVKTTRLARGLAAGSSVEYADEITLVNALKHRR